MSSSVADTNFNTGEDTARTFLEEQYQFNGTGTFNLNDTKQSLKFYPSVSKRIKAQDLDLTNRGMPKINFSSKNMVKSKMS
jgi:hypothetical protein